MIAAGLLLPASALGQDVFGTPVVGNTICARSFMSACATIDAIGLDATGTILTLTVRNSSDISNEDVFASSFFGSLLLKVNGGATADIIDVDVGSSDRSWRIRNHVGNIVSVDWTDGFDKQGSAINGIRTGETAIITITFDQAITLADLELWTVKMQNIGSAANCPEGEGECSGWSVIPEPITMVLLGTGLAGLGGASALRRRRRGFDIETE